MVNSNDYLCTYDTVLVCTPKHGKIERLIVYIIVVYILYGAGMYSSIGLLYVRYYM